MRTRVTVMRILAFKGGPSAGSIQLARVRCEPTATAPILASRSTGEGIEGRTGPPKQLRGYTWG